MTRLLDGTTGETSENTRKELGVLGYNACDPKSTLTQEVLEKWIRATIEPAFWTAAEDELKETWGEQNLGGLGHLLMDEDSLKDLYAEAQTKLEKFEEALGYAALKHDIEYKEQCFLLSHIQEFAAAKLYLDHTGDDEDRKSLPDPHGYNSSLMLHGDPYGLMNVLTQSPHKEAFFEMPTQAISALQPMIRLFKIEPDDSGHERQVEMKFDSHYRKEDVEEFMKTKEIRGHGIGIKSFTFSFEGADPWSSTRSMKAKLVLFANSFDELMKDRAYTAYEQKQSKDDADATEWAAVTRYYRYIDLAIKTGGVSPNDQPQDTANPQNKDVRIEDTSKLNFRLKAIVGWATPKDSSVISSDLLSAIYDSCITLNLTPTIHEFGIDEMGRTTLTINYWGSAEEFFDQPQYNIFTDHSIATRQIIRRLRYKILNENCEDSDLKNEVLSSKNNGADAVMIKEEKLANMRSLMNNMINDSKVRILNIPLTELQKYHAGGPFRPLSESFIEEIKAGTAVVAGEPELTVEEAAAGWQELIDSVDDLPDDPADMPAPGSPANPLTPGANTNTPQNPNPSTPTDPYNIGEPIEAVSYFYAGDLIDTILKYIGITIVNLPHQLQKAMEADEFLKKYTDVIHEEVNNYKRFAQNFMKFRLILGPIELVNTNTTGKILDSKIFNLGDIPVSVKYFMEFLNERIFKRERETYTLPEFLNDFFMIFLRDFLNKDSCYGNRAKQKTILHKNVITAYNEEQHEGWDPIAFWCKENGKKRMNVRDPKNPPPQPILNVMGKRDNAGFDGGFENEMHYLTYFVARVQPTELMLGLKSSQEDTGEVNEDGDPITVPTGDHVRGLWHYQIGKDRGIVKSIDLVKSDTPGLAEARWASEGYDNLQQLRVLYNANIKTFLDVNTYPGTYIYVEPRGFDPNTEHDLTQFGIGGYFMIKSAEHTLGPGVAETTIDARWVNEISSGPLGKKAPLQEIDAKPAVPKKCHVALFTERAPYTDLNSMLEVVGVPPEPATSDTVDTGSEDAS